jgi:putative ABC transport system substrate-binding protein
MNFDDTRRFLSASMLRGLIIVLAAVIASTATFGQQRPKQARIGYVSPAAYNATDDDDEYLTGLRKGLANRGYAEGQNLVIEVRYANGVADRLPSLISGLLTKGVDLLLTDSSQTTIVAQHLTSSVPIVFLSGDPIGAGLVSSLAHPRANLTGVSLLSIEVSVKWLQLLADVAPGLHRVGVIWNPANPVIAGEVERIRQVAPKLGVEIATFSVSPSNIGAGLEAIATAGVDGLIVTDDSIIQSIQDPLIAFAAERGLPAVWGLESGCLRGALMSYHSNVFALGERAARYVDQILKGVSPSNLPVEQASDFILRINLKTAKALGLTIPPSLLAVANEVFE